MANYLIYGANGYTGTLIARLAASRGQRPILAGRNGAEVAALAGSLGVESRVFGLDAIDRGLEGVSAVLHCAGPFARTTRLMASACLRSGVHYLDVTGEIVVFETLAAMDGLAQKAGVMLMPGVGFDVVPTDCLAAHLKRRLPTATRLRLGFQIAGGVSRGTARTMAENLGAGGAVRKRGKIVKVPACWKTRRIDFGLGETTAMTIPWGDVSTAWYTTNIPDIEVYMAAPISLRIVARLSRGLGWLLGMNFVQRRIARRIAAGPAGPSDAQRQRGKSLVWGEALDERGGRVTSRLRGPEGYTLTALTALAVMERVMAGESRPGFQTPARMYGADFILGIPGVERVDG
jgi:short subunit dehydrogenase-like uncharacterized protein